MRNAAGKPPTAKSNLSKMAVSGDRAARRDPHRDRRVRPNRDRVCRNRPDLPNRRDRHSDDHPAEAADDGPNDCSPSKAWWRPKPWRPRKRRKGVSIFASASPSEHRPEECARSQKNRDGRLPFLHLLKRKVKRPPASCKETLLTATKIVLDDVFPPEDKKKSRPFPTGRIRRPRKRSAKPSNLPHRCSPRRPLSELRGACASC